MKNKRFLIIKLMLITLIALALDGCATSYSGYTSYTTGFVNPSPRVIPQEKQAYKKAGDLWDDMAGHFNLSDETESNPLVKQQINWYIQHPNYLNSVATKAQPYLYYIYQQVKRRDLPAEVTLMPMVESAYNPFAINMGSGASGLWQMTTGTALGFGLHLNWWYDGRRDVVASTNAALDYLAYLGSFFNDNWLLAIAAYDSGEGTVQRAIEKNAKKGKPTDFWSLSLPKETQIYVPKVLALATIIEHRSRYPMIKFPPIPDAPYLAQVDVGSQIDLSQAAQMAGLSVEALSELNPGYNRWATSPDGPFKLLLPITHVSQFEDKLDELPISKRVKLYSVVVKPGDTLPKLATRYQTTEELIQQTNHLHSTSIHIGQVLLIPNHEQNTVTNFIIGSEQHFAKSLRTLPDPHVINYEVQKNDTLASIGARFHVTQRQLEYWNGMKSNAVEAGETISIWPPQPKKEKLTYTAWSYTVKAGDDLFSISRRYHVSTPLIREYNHLHGNVIRKGQVLKMPSPHYTLQKTHTTTHATASKIKPTKAPVVPSSRLTLHKTTLHATAHAPNSSSVTHYVVKRGDTLYSIARKHHVSVSQLMTWNHMKSTNDLHFGKTLTIN